MSDQFNSKEFKTLKDKWYKELKKTGFKDIEGENECMTKTVQQPVLYDFKNGFHLIHSAYFSACLDFYYKFNFDCLKVKKVIKKYEILRDTSHEKALDIIKKIWLCKCRAIGRVSGGKFIGVSQSVFYNITMDLEKIFVKSKFYDKSWANHLQKHNKNKSGDREVFDICEECGKEYMFEENGATYQKCSKCNEKNPMFQKHMQFYNE